jgi:hypothetical protein
MPRFNKIKQTEPETKDEIFAAYARAACVVVNRIRDRDEWLRQNPGGSWPEGEALILEATKEQQKYEKKLQELGVLKLRQT